MPGYQALKYHQQPEFQHREPIYSFIKSGRKSDEAFIEDLKSRQTMDRSKYEKHQKNREMTRAQQKMMSYNMPRNLSEGNLRHHMEPHKQYFPNYSDFSRQYSENSMPKMHSEVNLRQFDSLKLLGAQNDSGYLDAFMTNGRSKRHPSASDVSDRNKKNTITKSSSTIFSKGQRKSVDNTANAATVQLAMLSQLKAATSAESLYKSVEQIHFLKAKKSHDRARKTQNCAKSGHPLFDHLREEQALKEPERRTCRREDPLYPKMQRVRNNQMNSVGNSPSPSPSSSSSDEYDIYPKLQKPSSRTATNHRSSDNKENSKSGPALKYGKDQKKNNDMFLIGSESEDEFKVIPRPKLVKVIRHGKVVTEVIPSDESDTSCKSSGLR